ncbi:MAG: oxidoreductase, partial [Phyllobacteriaceae bacterium]|nr:oxidoreductase [Phyllobacteriaceae bacterium]
MNSVGIMSSAGIGKVLADWAVDGDAPSDLWAIDIARVDPLTATPAHLATRMEEAVSDLFALHWPFKQPKAGRNLRKSALHERWAAQGAVFGLTAGWERGLWYAHDERERNLPYAIGEQPWYPIAVREAAVMDRGAALIDLSPFTKIDVRGADALALLQHVATANIDVTVGRAVYTPFLNGRGGIEADVTVTRLGSEHFRVVSGAATRWKDGAHLRRAATGLDAVIEDVTEKFCVVGLMGAAARHVLGNLSHDDWTDFAFSTAREVTVAATRCLATRLSFVGELGWELMIPAAGAATVFDALIDAGARPFGHYALDACRIEKGYRHWGHDLGPDITPLEAGLAFTIDWSKDFRGKNALLHQRSMGLGRRMVLLDVSGHPLMLHDEPIFEGGKVVGMTTSGARGARTGLTLALGLVSIAETETLAQTCARNFKIHVAGQDYVSRALAKPPFDAAGKRMQA